MPIEIKHKTTNETLCIFQKANLWGASLKEANLKGADLREARLWGTDLRGADLWGADLKGANLTNTQGLSSFCTTHQEAEEY